MNLDPHKKLNQEDLIKYKLLLDKNIEILKELHELGVDVKPLKEVDEFKDITDIRLPVKNETENIKKLRIEWWENFQKIREIHNKYEKEPNG
jgi:uncharacterized protein YjgD (DUF1641 family)